MVPGLQVCPNCRKSSDASALAARDPRCPHCHQPFGLANQTLPLSEAAISTMLSGKVQGGDLDSARRYALVVVAGQSPGEVIPLQKARVTIGRSGCDIVVNDPELSRQHALIAISGSTARLEDLGSTNGVFVGEERIDQIELTDRSEFRVGSHEFVFVISDAIEGD